MFPLFASNRFDELIVAAISLLWIVPELILSRTRRPDPSARADDRFSGIVVVVCLWLGIAGAYASGFGERQFTIEWHRTLLFLIGIVLMIAGLLGRWYSIRALGKYFTVVVAIQPAHRIIDVGPYHYVRHPSYSGALLTIFGFGLVFTNWLSLVSVVLIAAVGYGYRIAVEEKALLEALGEPYRQYMKRTRRIIPFVI